MIRKSPKYVWFLTWPQLWVLVGKKNTFIKYLLNNKEINGIIVQALPVLFILTKICIHFMFQNENWCYATILNGFKLWKVENNEHQVKRIKDLTSQFQEKGIKSLTLIF